MRSWRVTQGCVFCGERDESRDHFFCLPVYFYIWLAVAGGLLGNKISPDWNETVLSLQHPSCSRLDYALLRLVFQASVYFLWREINSRRQHNDWISSEQLCRNIDMTMQNRILSLKYRPPYKFEGLMRRWIELTDC